MGGESIPVLRRGHKNWATFGAFNGTLLVFWLALALRLLLLGFSTHDPHATADSAIYIGIGHGIADLGEFVRKYSDHYEAVTERVPIYPLFLAFFLKIFGDGLTLPLIVQCMLDSLTCVLIALVGKELQPRLFFMAGMLAVFNLNMAIHATLILTDTVFLLFLVSFIFAILKYTARPAVKWAIMASMFFALAVLTRPLIYYFVPVFLVGLLAVPLLKCRSFKVAVAGCGAGLGILALFIGPLLARNHHQYGYTQLVSYGGANAMEWYVPLAFQYSTGESTDAVIKREQARLAQLMENEPDKTLLDNPFYVSKLQVRVALDEFKSLGMFQIVYAWTGGALLNVFTPSLSSLPALVEMKRPRFFETEGRNFVNKAFNFLAHPGNRLYLLLVVPSILLTLLSRGIALVGLFFCVQRPDISKMAGVILLVTTLYFLAITGPLVSAARYRLPIEPILIVFLALGLVSLYDRACFWNASQPRDGSE